MLGVMLSSHWVELLNHFRTRALHFHFAMGPANSKAGPASHHSEKFRPALLPTPGNNTNLFSVPIACLFNGTLQCAAF